MALALLFLVGILLLAAPIILPVAGIPVPLGATFAMLGIGGALVIGIGLLWIFKKLYVKTSAHTAFVRTGRGFKIIKDGGAIVIPFLHEVVWVSLKTFKVKIERTAKQALLTSDKLRVDIIAEFYVKVAADEDAIGAASRSFGDEMNSAGVTALIQEKLISALRSVAAQKTLEELNSDRKAFMEEVTKMCTGALKHNGLDLEDAAISHLDQTNSEHLDPNNVFDAQGMRTSALITETNKTQTNELVRNGEEARKRKDVETRKAMLTLDQDKERAESEQTAEVAKIRAQQERESKEKVIEADKAVELAEVEKRQAIEVAKKREEQAIEVESQKKQQAIEVATRNKEAQIALAEKERAEKQSELAQAEKVRQEKQEEIETVKVVQAAERAKQQEVIAAQADAAKKIAIETGNAEAAAVKVERDAAARKTAADADAEAIKKKAEAEKDAEIARSEGQKAREMIPIEVKRAEVDVDKRRIEEVVKPELEARDKYGKAQQDFELAQLAISAEKEVRIESARASVAIYQKMEVRALTTLEEVDKVRSRIVQGEGAAGLIGSFMDNLDVGAVMGAVNVAKTVVDTVRGTGGTGSNGAAGGGAKPVVPTTTKTPIAPAVPPVQQSQPSQPPKG